MGANSCEELSFLRDPERVDIQGSEGKVAEGKIPSTAMVVRMCHPPKVPKDTKTQLCPGEPAVSPIRFLIMEPNWEEAVNCSLH